LGQSFADETSDVLKSEVMLEELRTPLANLAQAVRRKKLAFDPVVKTVDLARSPTEGHEVLETGAVRRSWPAGRSGAGSLWRPFLTTVAKFEHFSFYNIRGAFEGDSYRTLTGFKGLARLKSGKLAHVAGRAKITWKHHEATSFETGAFEITEFSEPLFEDVLASTMSKEDHARLVHSERDADLVTWINKIRNEESFDEQLPGLMKGRESGTTPVDNGQICIVDLDADGHDDFYVSASTDKALFFRSRGDGTYEEIGTRLGLDIEGVHAAVFADFDNDGDKGAFLSYLRNGVRYMRQDKGKFVEQKEASDFLPSWVVCMAVADYNRDGLLDVYFGSWAGGFIGAVAAVKEGARREGKAPDMKFPGFESDEAEVLSQLLLDEKADPILARPGPPNVLLRNTGGRFVRDKKAGVEVYFNTMATTWADFDRDGDMDLYVTNEAGPNRLFRNRGDGAFEDFSDEVTGEVGYGMGASWGDYDNDGRIDLYVTNMYSKAGIRIAERHRANLAIVASARGNSLIRNRGGKFERIAASPATAADFGWGGKFVDFDNDGRLDIYAPAGYVTIPPEVGVIGDT
jgi:hypothetical protein